MPHKSAFKILLILNSIGLLVFLFLLYTYVHEQNYQVQASQQAITQKMRVAIQKIDKMLSELSSIAHVMADDLSTGKLHRTQIMDRLEKNLEKTSYQYGMGVAYIPYVNDPQMRRRSPYYLKSVQKNQEEQLQLSIPCSYRDPTTQLILSRCVVFVDYSLKDIKTLIAPLNIGKTGYGFILSKKGVFIEHPIKEYIKERKTIFNIATVQNNKLIKQLAQRAINGESGVIDTKNQLTKQSSWIFYQPILTTGWTMVVVVTKNEILEPLQHQQIWVILSFIIFLICFFALLFHAYPWALTFSTAILLLVGISCLLWFFAEINPLRPSDDSAIIVNNAGLNQFLSSNAKPTIFVPTGVIIESIKFLENNNVTLSGQIWQKYPIDKDIYRQLILPKAKSIQISEIDRYTENKIEVIKWHFEGTMSQQFDDSKYPFDNRAINLLIDHTDNQVILTPDFAKNSIMGVKQGLFLPNWTIKHQFFNYKTKDLKLYFTVFTQRQFSNLALISILPMLIVLGMLFAILLLLGKVKSLTNVIAPLVALFLATIIAHIGLKIEISTFNPWGIIYIDYFYLITYIAILAVISYYLLFQNNSKLGFISYQNGIVAKLLFWPFILGTLLGITIWKFY